jgi:hypothetical protein
MENGGNAKVNIVYEALLHRSSNAKPDTTATGPTRERYIRDKYERRKYYDPTALEKFTSTDHGVDEDKSPPSTLTSKRVPSTRAPTALAAVSRAPSDVARRRAEARQARVVGNSVPADRLTRLNSTAPPPTSAPPPPSVPPPTESLDLLDFGSTTESTSTAPPPSHASSSNQNDTLDLFANMNVSSITSNASAPAPVKSNEDILSLFASPQPNTNMMGNQNPQSQMMSGSFPNQGPMMIGGLPNMGQSFMNQSMVAPSQTQMSTMQQPMPMITPQMQMMMMQQQQMMMQQANQNAYGLQQFHTPMTNPTGQQNMNTMMSNSGMSGMMVGIQQQQPMMMMPASQMQSTDGSFGAPMGSGPSISSLQGQPQKEDPFAQFGFNAFR